MLYLAATNQVVSAALVAQREVDEAESGQITAESEKDQNSSEHGNKSNPKEVRTMIGAPTPTTAIATTSGDLLP